MLSVLKLRIPFIDFFNHLYHGLVVKNSATKLFIEGITETIIFVRLI